MNQALLLGASLYGLVRAMLADGVDRAIPPRRRWDRKRLPKPLLVPPGRFEFAGTPRRQETRPAFALHEFLSSVPKDWAAQLCRWAPPVVARPPQPDEKVPVLENVFPAWLAMHSAPLDGVWCRVLEKPARPRFTVQELAVFAFPYLEEWVMGHREHIAVAAPSLAHAVMLTGWSRAKAAKVRQRAGEAT